MTQCGLFVGLTTLDLIYQVEQVPAPNQKVVAIDSIIAAGGPATNAAVTFAHLDQAEFNKDDCAKGGAAASTILLTALGSHPMSQMISAEVRSWGVAIAALMPDSLDMPSVSSILVTQATGERAVVSLNAVKQQQGVEQIPADILQDVAIVLIDGHQITVGEAIAQRAKARKIPIVVDGGSWKPGFERILPWADYAICSTNFYPPNCSTEADVVAYLSDLRIPHIAITHGDQPIRYCASRNRESLDDRSIAELPVPPIQAVDTLGAGDIFHGAFCHFILRSPFVEALTQSAAIAARSCQHFGPREWMRE